MAVGLLESYGRNEADRNPERMENLLLPGGQHLAHSPQHVALFRGDRKKFKAVAQPLTIAHQGSNFQWIGSQRQGHFDGDNFARLEFSCKRDTDAILSQLAGASPHGCDLARAENLYCDPHIHGKARKPAREFRGIDLFGSKWFHD